MKQTDLIVGALAGIALCGVIALSILQLEVGILTPILGALVGYFIGTNKGNLGKMFGKK